MGYWEGKMGKMEGEEGTKDSEARELVEGGGNREKI